MSENFKYEKPYSRKETQSQYWYNKAMDLHTSAGMLYVTAGTDPSLIIKELGLDPSTNLKVASGSVMYMLCGLSIEIILKAIILEKGKTIKFKHTLGELANDAEISLSSSQMKIAELLSESIIWGGKYPLPKNETFFDNFLKKCEKYLWKPPKIGKLNLLEPSGLLSWDSYNALWNQLISEYFTLKKEVQ